MQTPFELGPVVPQFPRLLRVTAWLLFAAIVFVTLSPIGLRPVTGEPPNLERAVAFAVFGAVFAIAYPRRLPLVIGLVVAAAIGLELLQMLAATRHARMPDMGFKLLGGGIGIAIGTMLTRWLPVRR